ncbi:Transcriptional regulatory protein QseB [Nymphon striatum]|nr:Transcriptional regulatory protein QseB [Nymphon striatum]
MRLLLVEDTEDVADAIVASFERRGDALDHVVSVEEAKSALAVQEYDVIILDIGLPDGLGTAVLKSVRDRGSRTPVLMLTARSDIEDRVRALDQGADDYLVKPSGRFGGSFGAAAFAENRAGFCRKIQPRPYSGGCGGAAGSQKPGACFEPVY